MLASSCAKSGTSTRSLAKPTGSIDRGYDGTFDVLGRLLLAHAFSSPLGRPILRHSFTDCLARSRGHPAALAAGSADSGRASRTAAFTSTPAPATCGKSTADSGDFGFELLNSGCRTVSCQLAKLISRKRIRQIDLLLSVD